MNDGKTEMYEPVSDPRHGDHQLTPLKGGRYDQIIHGPPGTDVGDLHIELEPVVFEDQHPTTVTHSGWHVSEEHLEQIEQGAHVRLSLWQHPMPPVAVSVEPPVCACHGDTMEWDPDEGNYYCAHLTRLDQRATGEPAKSALDQAHEGFKPRPDEQDPYLGHD
jgi:hypothetical protein